ncbi:hypothetical protein E2C01_100343 [Portunus trituberculatus]|uniref:Uncharacterized protein n=1 Tax=Portunus trituberculatus TaxID=210409 RepID=A0A5B7KJ89_PORTR|nr:hypothetical protein [Portunus trituberculatus]
MVQSVSASNSSRRMTYRQINPDFTISEVYTNKHTIKEQYKVAYTRSRLSAHSLACETGRWNRRGRGRIPLEERLSVCGQVQTEAHVITSCPLFQHLRYLHSFSNIKELFKSFPINVSCKVIYDVLSLYE